MVAKDYISTERTLWRKCEDVHFHSVGLWWCDLKINMTWWQSSTHIIQLRG